MSFRCSLPAQPVFWLPRWSLIRWWEASTAQQIRLVAYRKSRYNFPRTKFGGRKIEGSWMVPMGLAAPVKIRYIVVGNTERKLSRCAGIR